MDGDNERKCDKCSHRVAHEYYSDGELHIYFTCEKWHCEYEPRDKEAAEK